MNRKTDQVGDDDRDWCHQPRKVNLAEDARVGSKGVRGAVETARKVMPHDRAGHVKEHLRQAVGWQPGNLTEDNGVDQGGEEGLDDEPERTEDGLLVTGDKVAPHKKGDQVAVVPDLF